MKVTVYSAKPYDERYLKAANAALGHELVFHEARLKSSTVDLARGSDAVCVFVHDEVDKAAVEALSEIGVKIIALRCAGFNNVDLDATSRLGIHVVRVPSYSPFAVAEHTIALMLSLNRKTHRAYHRVRDGNFSLQGLTGFDMYGKTVGVIGTGRIGSIVLRILHGFGCRLLAHDQYENESLKEIGVEYVSREELLASVDILSFHCPLTPQTFHLINEETLACMKGGVMIINTSRGAIVDAQAAIDGLKSGKISYLGLDVYEQEGDIFFRDLSDVIIRDDVFERLLTFHNVLITGHQGYFTDEALHNIAETTLENLANYDRGDALVYLLKPEQAVVG